MSCVLWFESICGRLCACNHFTFSSVFANCGVKFIFASCNLLKKTNVLCIGDGDHMFVVK